MDEALATSRRTVVRDSVGIAVGVAGAGIVFGISARATGLSAVEATAMSILVFAGSAQFAALGSLGAGTGAVGVTLLTAFLNARNAVYAAALAPWLAGTARWRRALMAHLVTDETFALSLAHFHRIGRADEPGYWGIAVGAVLAPWVLATLAGALLAGVLPNAAAFGLEVIFPAAMAGIATTLAADRRAVTAAVLGAAAALGISLASDPAIGLVMGSLLGALLALGVRAADR